MVFNSLLASSVKHSNGNARCTVELGIAGVTYLNPAMVFVSAWGES